MMECWQQIRGLLEDPASYTLVNLHEPHRCQALLISRHKEVWAKCNTLCLLRLRPFYNLLRLERDLAHYQSAQGMLDTTGRLRGGPSSDYRPSRRAMEMTRLAS